MYQIVDQRWERLMSWIGAIIEAASWRGNLQKQTNDKLHTVSYSWLLSHILENMTFPTQFAKCDLCNLFFLLLVLQQFFSTYFAQNTLTVLQPDLWSDYLTRDQAGFTKWRLSKVCCTCLDRVATGFTHVSRTTKIGGRLTKQQSGWLEPISSPKHRSGQPYQQQQSWEVQPATLGHYSSLPQSRDGGAGTENSHARVTEGVTKARCAEGT